MSSNPEKNEPEVFEDPLEDYEPKTYGDDVQRALAEEDVGAIQHHPFATITPDTTVGEAVAKLAGFHIACLLVEVEGELVGVLSDRDILNKVALEYETVCDQPVSSVMTANPVYVYTSDPSAAALSVMAVSGYRHIPILDLDNKIAGIASPQRVTHFLHGFFGDD